jgi:hypothetical protein
MESSTLRCLILTPAARALAEDTEMAVDALDRDLRFAIANKRLLQLTYSGVSRTVEPHDYGRDKSVERLLAYQLDASGETKKPGWRLFDVAKIERCAVLDQTFAGSRGTAHRNHKSWDELYARVE